MNDFLPFNLDALGGPTEEQTDGTSSGETTPDGPLQEAEPRQPDDAALLTTDDLHRLLAVVSQLNAVGDPQALMASIIETAADLLDCAAASLLLYDEAFDRLRFVAATGTDTATLAAIPVPLFGSIAGTIFREGIVVNTARAQEDTRHYSAVGKKVDFETQSLLGVPMRIEDRVVGVLEALNKHDGDFDARDERLLALLADQMAVTLRNARQREAVHAAYERLAQIEAAKSNFLTLTSHELRTPLATIRGFATLLQDEALDDNTRDFAALIVDAALRMGQVVEVMGELSELRLGAARRPFEVVEVGQVLTKVKRAVETRANAKRIQVRVEVPSPELAVEADAVRLDMAVQHLMANAITFTPEGGAIALYAVAEHNGVTIRIEDTGCGIDAEHLDTIFREYYQVENALTRSHGGLGLGLTVVRGIAEMHGGRVWAESQGEGYGSVFALWLPSTSV